ncbi:MAG TPA: uroporphyrinogen-III C-methyltransferase [Candidatus Dormibacteraeota bacterium]
MTHSTYFPVFLDVRGRGCVVLGDGDIADEKAAALRAAGALVTHHRRAFQPGDLRNSFLAIDASGDPAAQTDARLEAEAHRVLLNVVDVAAKSDWIAPAVVRRGPVAIAVSTSGESPFIASTLRARLEGEFGEEWGSFTRIVGTVRRRLRRRGVAAEQQRAVYRRLLRSPVRALLSEGRAREAAALAVSIESASYDGAPERHTGEVVLVGAGPGDAGLLTIAGAEALQHSDVVLHDALVDAGVLRLCPRGARIVDVGKRAGRESVSQEHINQMLIEAARVDQLVVRLKGGDPFLFGRGGEEVEALVRAGIPVRVIPGVSSALAAPAAAGIPLTHRGVAASIAIVTGERAASAPGYLEHVAAAVETLVVLMPHRLEAIVESLVAALGAERPAALICSAYRAGEHVLRGPLASIPALAAPLDSAGPRTLVVGEVTDLLQRTLQTAAYQQTG